MKERKKQNFLIDGFPRNKENLDGWNKDMSDVASVKRVLFFNCDEEVRCSNILLPLSSTPVSVFPTYNKSVADDSR